MDILIKVENDYSPHILISSSILLSPSLTKGQKKVTIEK